MKHLMRGVKLGLFDEQTAMQKFETWNATHETQVLAKMDSHKKAKAAAKQQPIIKKVEAVVEEAPVAEAPVVEEAPAVEETAAPEAPAAEETPAAE